MLQPDPTESPAEHPSSQTAPSTARVVSEPELDYRRKGKGKIKSAVTNGARLFVQRPGDTRWSRRFKDIYAIIIDDVTTTPDTLSEAQRQLARRATTLSILCEKIEGEAAAAEDTAEIDYGLIVAYGRLTSQLTGVLHRLGIKRVPRTDTTLTLTDLLKRDRSSSSNGQQQKQS